MLRSIPIVEPALQPRRIPFIQPFQPDPSLVLWLLPQRDAKWYDYSGKGNHGTIHGAIWKPDRAGSVLSFNGTNDYVDCGKDASLNITDAITIAAWIKTTGLTGTYQFVVDYKYSDVIYLGGREIEGKLLARAYIKDSAGTSALLQGTTDMNDGKYHHLVLTFEAGTGKLWLDTVVQQEKSVWGNNLATSTKHVYISDDGNYKFNGTIGEVMIFNRTLNAAEATRIFRLERVWYGV